MVLLRRLKMTVQAQAGVSTFSCCARSMLTAIRSFFSNKGAVAGVFTVVGLIGLVLLIVVATNVIRRRRAKKFDDEVAAAAAEANATAPRYPFDDYDDPATGGGAYAMSSKYSDPESHGTLNQQPMSHEAYGMSEYNNQFNPSYGNIAAGVVGSGAGVSMAHRNVGNGANEFGAGAGIAGFGAGSSGANNINRSISPGQAIPYNAFGGPDANGMLGGIPADPYDPYTAGSSGIRRQDSRGGHEMFDAAIAAAGSGAAGQAALNRGPSQATTLNRKPSAGTSLTHDTGNGGATQESYAAHYQPDFRSDAHEYHTVGGPAAGVGRSNSGGNAANQDVSLPNPFARDDNDEDAYAQDSYMPAQAIGHNPADDDKASVRDEEDYGRGGRTLKVCPFSPSSALVLRLMSYDQVANE